MFAFLRGTVAIKALDHIALDVGGVGYLVQVPETVHRKLAVNQEVLLQTYCHIREESFQIFGFLKEDEKSLFMTLLDINGVGPRVALALLSTLPVAEFGRAITENNVKALTKAPGVGTKLAQRVLLEMKSKMGQSAELGAILGEAEAGETDSGDDVLEALLALGCTPAEAKKAAAHARRTLGQNARDEQLVAEALRSLVRK
jgi:Holliday junction DNA helicase RuvA